MPAAPRPHLLSSANFSQFQSAYRKGHSTETALLEVLDGVFTVADDKQVKASTCWRPSTPSTTGSSSIAFSSSSK